MVAEECPSKVAVIGGGFVGLHTAVHAAMAGVNSVVVVDINPEIVERINSGDPARIHVKEEYVVENLPALLREKRLRATTSYREVRGAEVVVVAVQTPLKRGPGGSVTINYGPLRSVAELLHPYLEPGTLVSSETTIYPGGTRELLAEPLERLSGLRLDEQLFVAHAPERLSPGMTEWGPHNIPRIVGGVGPRSLERAVRFYGGCLKVPVHPVDDIRVAEAAKLLENSFRLLNISFINEIKRSFDRIGINVKEVINAASTKPFGYMAFYPGPYAGGACLPKDSYMMEQFTGSLLLRIAREVNETQPLYYAAKLLKTLRSRGARRVLFYGLGFKPGSPYPVESPVLRVIDELKELDPSLDIRKYDPMIPELSDFDSEEEALRWADTIVTWGYRRLLGKPHSGNVIALEDL